MSSDDRRTRKYQIVLMTPMTTTEEEATRRLRGLLKSAWRVFGLKCTSAVEITQTQKELDQ